MHLAAKVEGWVSGSMYRGAADNRTPSSQAFLTCSRNDCSSCSVEIMNQSNITKSGTWPSNGNERGSLIKTIVLLERVLAQWLLYSWVLVFSLHAVNKVTPFGSPLPCMCSRGYVFTYSFLLRSSVYLLLDCFAVLTSANHRSTGQPVRKQVALRQTCLGLFARTFTDSLLLEHSQWTKVWFHWRPTWGSPRDYLQSMGEVLLIGVRGTLKAAPSLESFTPEWMRTSP